MVLLLIVRLLCHWQPIRHMVLQQQQHSIKKLPCMDHMLDMELVSSTNIDI